MTDKELMEMLQKSTEDIKVPESLRPEAVKERLKAVENEKKTEKKPRVRPWMYQVGAAAAALALCVSVFWSAGRGQDEGRMESAAVQEAESTVAGDAADAEEILADADAAAADTGGEDAGRTDTGWDSSLGGYMAPADSYSAIFQKLEEFYADLSNAEEEETAVGTVEDAGVDTSAGVAEDTAKMELPQGAAEHSDTNVQVEGVDEGDIVKTDGEYLYVLRANSGVKIVRAEDLKLMSEIKWNNTVTDAYDMYLDGGSLVVIGRAVEAKLEEGESEAAHLNIQNNLTTFVYDVSDSEAPKLKGSVTQDGSYLTSRKNGNYLYLISRYTPDAGFVEEKTEGYVPNVDGVLMEEADIYLPTGENAGDMYSYLVVTSVDIRKPDRIKDSCAVVTDSYSFYVSKENVYASGRYYDGNGDASTTIVKFAYEDGALTPAAGGLVPGELLNDFSMDEYQGHLRVVSMDWSRGRTTTGLYVLDEQLKIVGRIDDLAAGERLKSARFMGDQGYFVTFLETDPLFSADLSDPENPRIIGELKIPGFSSYLHFWEQDLLLGIGWEDNEATGLREGKLSMFDISDPSDVTESDKKILKNATEFPAAYEYKSVLVDAGKGRFGFAYGSWEEDRNWSDQRCYYAVYQYEAGEGFIQEFCCLLNEEDGFGDYMDDVRGVTIGDSLYIIMERGISVFDLAQKGEKTGSLVW